MAETKQLSIAEVNWLDKDSIVNAFPSFVREQFALARAKGVTHTIDIEDFCLKQPFSSNYLLQDTRLTIEPNKRICLIGDSGTGKSTLFDAMNSGVIKEFPRHLQVYKCAEIDITPENKDISVIDTVVRSHEYRNILLACQAAIKKLLEAGPAASDLEALKASEEFVEMQLTRMNSAGAVDRASKMLRVLGFDDVGQTKPISSLSGGLRMRVALCAAFFVNPDVLLLDEPTNHLDFPSVLWLENRLRGYSKSFLLICHDRDLLNNTVTQCMLLEQQKIVMYPCGFAEFEKKRAAADKKYDAEIDKFLMRNRNVDFSSPQAREKAEKLAWREAYMAKQVMLAGKFTFPPLAPLPAEKDEAGNPLPNDKVSIINIKNVRFSYDEKAGLPFIFDTPIDFNVMQGTRCGVMGPNGAGKSTLLKLITDRLKPVSGDITRHRTAKVAYFAQHTVADLDVEQTPMEFMEHTFKSVRNTGLLRKHLEKVGISGNLADTRIIKLSAGQRSCVVFAKITYDCPHLLIMDEPTNFLDLESIDSLIQGANKFPGALLLVSHNRQFLLKTCKQFLSVVPGHFNIYDDLKTCEKATYTFIQELEDGASGGKLGQGLLAKSTSAGTNAVGAAGNSTMGAAKPAGGFVISTTLSTSRAPLRGRGAPVAAATAGRGGATAAPGRGGARGGAAGGRGGAPQRGGRGGNAGGRGGRGGRGH